MRMEKHVQHPSNRVLFRARVNPRLRLTLHIWVIFPMDAGRDWRLWDLVVIIVVVMQLERCCHVVGTRA